MAFANCSSKVNMDMNNMKSCHLSMSHQPRQNASHLVTVGKNQCGSEAGKGKQVSELWTKCSVCQGEGL